MMTGMTMEEGIKLISQASAEGILEAIAKEFASDDPTVCKTLNIGRLYLWSPGKVTTAMALLLCIQAREQRNAYMGLLLARRPRPDRPVEGRGGRDLLQQSHRAAQTLVFTGMKNESFKKIATAETKYEGGAQRDSRLGKGAPEWMPSQALALVSCIYQFGNIQRDKLAGGTGNGDSRNWENGMKIGDLLGSAIRHIERHKEGDRF